jgi:hypothetical protein
MPNVPTDPDDPGPVSGAARLGVDLIHGRHHPLIAEAARRLGLEPLRFSSWGPTELIVLRDALDMLRVEYDILGDRIDVVDGVLCRHGEDAYCDDEDVADDIAATVGIPVGQVDAFIQETVPWWYLATQDWASSPPAWFARSR